MILISITEDGKWKATKVVEVTDVHLMKTESVVSDSIESLIKDSALFLEELNKERNKKSNNKKNE